MAKFLNTTATNYYLEELIKSASERLVLISPFLKLNDKVKELIEDKNRLKIDIRIVYGKSELQPAEINWLNGLDFVRTSFCKNLHAKCYLNEKYCIITSMNLYEFSQVNNNEMGIILSRRADADIYKDAYVEAQRIIRVSEEVRISLEKVVTDADSSNEKDSDISVKLTSSKLAQKHNMKTNELLNILSKLGYLENVDGKQKLTEKGESAGAEFKYGRHGLYFLWPDDIDI